MGSDLIPSLLLRHPLPLSSISLGRLVRDPLYPDVDYYDPFLGQRAGPDDDAGLQREQGFSPTVTESRLDDFERSLEASRGTRLELGLLRMLSQLTAHGSSDTTVRSRRCVVRQLRDPDAFFRAACGRDRGARAWLESEAARPAARGGGRAYLVCGFQTLTDATVSHTSSCRCGARVSPLGMGGAVATWLSKMRSSFSQGLRYTAQGERVYAVTYRRVRFSWFSGRSADSAYLDRRVSWKSIIGSRGDDDDDDEMELAAELEGGPEVDELDGRFTSAEIGGARMLFEDKGEIGE